MASSFEWYVNCQHPESLKISLASLVYTDQCWPVRTSADRYGPVLTGTDQCWPVRTSADRYGPVLTSTSWGALVRKSEYCPVIRFVPCFYTIGHRSLNLQYMITIFSLLSQFIYSYKLFHYVYFCVDICESIVIVYVYLLYPNNSVIIDFIAFILE